MSQAPTRVLVLESHTSASHGVFSESALGEGFAVTSATTAPKRINRFDVVVFNNVDVASVYREGLEQEMRDFVAKGGGCLATHDSIVPLGCHWWLMDLVGLRPALGGIQLPGKRAKANRYDLLLAQGDPHSKPPRTFPVRPSSRDVLGRAITSGIPPFDLPDEFWAMNIATGVEPLLIAEVGDRFFAPPRLQQPTVIAGARRYHIGRCVFLLVGHFAETYQVEHIRGFLRNAVAWCAKRLNPSEFAYDLFISYSSADVAKARQFEQKAASLGLSCFMDIKEIEPGDDWAEQIRTALHTSRELCVLVVQRHFCLFDFR
jgi:hypothetical protein